MNADISSKMSHSHQNSYLTLFVLDIESFVIVSLATDTIINITS